MREIFITADYVRMLLLGAQNRDVDVDPILAKHGFSKLSLNHKNTHINLSTFSAIAVDSMRAMNDEMLGLGVKRQPLGSFNMLATACISARTIKESLKRTALYWNLFENTYQHSLLVSSGKAYYELVARPEQDPPVVSYVAETLLSTVHRFHCWLTGQFIPLIEVHLSYPAPEHSNDHRRLFYNTSVSYDQPTSYIAFETGYLSKQVLQTRDSLTTYLQDSNLSILHQRKHYEQISDNVRQWLERNIRQGNYQATLAEAAHYFQLSQQALHRRLVKEKTSFKEIKMQTRRDIAIAMLFEENTRVEDIATKVGFSEPSAFIRAFKSWTGATPLAYRKAKL